MLKAVFCKRTAHGSKALIQKPENTHFRSLYAIFTDRGYDEILSILKKFGR
jgi:hypothetical protein